MKIAIVAPEVFPVPPVRGGAIESIIHEMSLRLTGHEVHIFGVSDSDLPLDETKEHVTYGRYKKNIFHHALLSTYKLPFKQSRSHLYYWPYSRWIASRLRKLNPDVVHVMSLIHFIPRLRKAASNAAFILSLHQLSSLDYGPKVWSQKNIDDCDLITGCSKFLTDTIGQRYPAAMPKLRTLYNGIDIEGFKTAEMRKEIRVKVRTELSLTHDPVILFVGRLVEQKGVHVLAEAFEKISVEFPRLQLLLAGSDRFANKTETPYIQNLKQRLSHYGRRVCWLGYIDREKMAAIYAACDVVVVPSIGPESFSLVTVEAMAAGLPVVAFAHGGPCELIENEKTGLLVNINDNALGISNALKRLIANPRLCDAMSHAAHDFVRSNFDWKKITYDIERIYRSARDQRCHRILIAESGTGFGGTARYLHDLVLSLDRSKFHVDIVAYGDGPFMRKIQKQSRVIYFKPHWRFAWLKCNILMAPIIASWLKNKDIKLVHLNNEILSHIPLLIAAKMAHCRIICHLHGWRKFTRIERILAGFIDEFICISGTGAAYFREQLPRHRVQAIPNGILIDRQIEAFEQKRLIKRQELRLNPNQVVVSLIGRLIPWKGHGIFLKALKVVMDRHDVIGIIAGSDETPRKKYFHELQLLTRELGIENRVRYLDFQEDVWPVYAASDIIIHASTEPEPFGLVVLEAMFAKRPVIATRGGGVGDMVVDGTTGILVDPADVEQLASAIKRLIDDPALAQCLSVNAYERASEIFDIKRNASAVSELYLSLLNAKK